MTDLPGILFLSIRIILALLLYTFLFLSIRVLWLNIKTKPANQSKHSAPPPLQFSIVDQNAYHKQILLEAPEASIGRSPDNTYQFTDATVSGHHARLFFESGQWWVQDLGSANGTILNDIQITDSSILAPDDEVQIGKVLLKIISTFKTNSDLKILEGDDSYG